MAGSKKAIDCLSDPSPALGSVSHYLHLYNLSYKTADPERVEIMRVGLELICLREMDIYYILKGAESVTKARQRLNSRIHDY